MTTEIRIAAITDIHGNRWALESVLADIGRHGADCIVNLGDVLSGPLEPRATAERLMGLELPTVRGNHDRVLARLAAGAAADQEAGHGDRFALSQLAADHLGWVGGFSEALALTDDVYCVHGAPGDDLQYLLEDSSSGWPRLRSAEAVARLCSGLPGRVLLCGHTHLPRVFMAADDRLVVNAGSVGLQAYEDDGPFLHRHENGSPHARYAWLERRGGRWQAGITAVRYDWHAASRCAAANGAPAWARWLLSGRA